MITGFSQSGVDESDRRSGVIPERWPKSALTHSIRGRLSGLGTGTRGRLGSKRPERPRDEVNQKVESDDGDGEGEDEQPEEDERIDDPDDHLAPSSMRSALLQPIWASSEITTVARRWTALEQPSKSDQARGN
jgi:hypothetical protein